MADELDAVETPPDWATEPAAPEPAPEPTAHERRMAFLKKTSIAKAADTRKTDAAQRAAEERARRLENVLAGQRRMAEPPARPVVEQDAPGDGVGLPAGSREWRRIYGRWL